MSHTHPVGFRVTPRRWRTAIAVMGTVAVLASGGLGLSSQPAAASPTDPIAPEELLTDAALDGRVADDGVTPVAVVGRNDEGESIIYGARPSTTAPTADLAVEPDGDRYFVDCETPTPGTGTQELPLPSLAAINALTLQPGDEVLFKRGSACTGMFQPQGSGTKDAPIIVDAYGDPSAPMARIDGAGQPQAVLLYNVQHYVVRNLELTNYTDDERDFAAGSVRRGVTVKIEDIGVGAGYTITDLYIHTIRGEGKKDNGGSGGIQFEVHGSQVPTKYTDVEVAFNTIRDTNRSGINMSTSWWGREEVQSTDGNYYAWDPMFIHDNHVSDVGGDGIVVQYASGSRVENNTVEDVANTKNGESMNGANAAVWPWNADHVSFRYNHVFNTVRGPDNNDGQAFDADYGGTGTLFEYNLTHGNEGGFMLFCGCWGLSSATVVRYNVSLDDGEPVPLQNGSVGIARTFFMAGQTDGEVYNNTFLLPPHEIDIAYPNRYLGDNVVFANNVFLAQEGTVVRETATARPENTIRWRNNVFGGTADGWPVGTPDDHNSVVPDLNLAAGSGLDQLRFDDEAVASAGVPIAPEGTADFLGNPVPTAAAPDAGAIQTSVLDPATQITVSDGGFESDPSPWTLSGSATQTTEQVRSGEHALGFGSGSGTASIEVPTAVNRTYRLVAAAKPGTSGDLPVVSVTLPSGATAAAVQDPDVAADEDGFVPLAVVFRTSVDASAVELTVTSAGGGFVDDVSVLRLDDLMVDGSFEAVANTVWQANNSQGQPALPRTTEATSGSLAATVSANKPSRNRFTYVATDVEYELGVWAHASADSQIQLSWANTAGQSQQIATTASNWTRLQVALQSSESRLTVSCTGVGTCDDMTLTSAWDGTVPHLLPDTEAPAPTWDAAAVYQSGDRVTHQGRTYQASWWTSGQEPGADPWGPWQEIATAPDGTAIWTPSRIFVAGDVVTYEGSRYRAQWWTRNQPPGQPWGPWTPVS